MTHSELLNMVVEIREKAARLYGFNAYFETRVRNMGRVGGTAQRTHTGHLILSLNEQLMGRGRDEAYNVVAHEIAHLVCFHFRHLGKNHDRGWQRVCMAIGGNGNRCHSMPLEKKRKTVQAIYIINNKEVKVGKTIHERIQNRVREYHLNPCRTTIKPEYFTGKMIQG